MHFRLLCTSPAKSSKVISHLAPAASLWDNLFSVLFVMLVKPVLSHFSRPRLPRRLHRVLPQMSAASVAKDSNDLVHLAYVSWVAT